MTGLRARVWQLPLRVRLTLAGTLLLTVALAVVFGLVFVRFEAGLNSAIDGDLRARAQTLAVVVRREGPGAIQRVDAQELLRSLGAFAQVVDQHGRALSSTSAVTRMHLLTPAQAATAARKGLRTDHGSIPHVAKRVRLVAAPLSGTRGGDRRRPLAQRPRGRERKLRACAADRRPARARSPSLSPPRPRCGPLRGCAAAPRRSAGSIPQRAYRCQKPMTRSRAWAARSTT